MLGFFAGLSTRDYELDRLYDRLANTESRHLIASEQVRLGHCCSDLLHASIFSVEK